MTSPLITWLLHHATAQGSRSTVLRPLNWLAAICVIGLLGDVELRGPNWVLVVFAAMLLLVMILYMGAYVFCLRTNPDLLRSETYSIRKLAIEKNLVGDSTVGILMTEGVLEGTVIEPPPNRTALGEKK